VSGVSQFPAFSQLRLAACVAPPLGLTPTVVPPVAPLVPDAAPLPPDVCAAAGRAINKLAETKAMIVRMPDLPCVRREIPRRKTVPRLRNKLHRARNSSNSSLQTRDTPPLLTGCHLRTQGRNFDTTRPDNIIAQTS
jgi:hypothetical protein